MHRLHIFKLLLICFIGMIGFGCAQSEAQRNFEQEALMEPAGIKAMDADGTPTDDGENDPNDWKTAPDFSGLFEVQTAAYPNPVSYNSSFEIDIYVKAVDAINGLYVYAFRQPSDLSTSNPLELYQQTLEPGVQSIIISPQEFAQNTGTGTIGNTYRIIFYDGQNKVITYGDVLVE